MRKWYVLSAVLLALGVAATAFLMNAGAKEEKAPAADALKTASSRITHVTVYQANALVTREVDVPEGPGVVELVVSPLPPMTVNSSLYSEGTDNIRVLTTRFRMRPIEEDSREEVRKLEAKLRERREADQKTMADINAVKQNMDMLKELQGFTGANTKVMTEKGNLNGETIITLAKYVMDQRTEKSKELVNLEQQQAANQEQIKFLERQLQELAAGSTRTERDAVIIVEKKNPAAGKIRLNYLVDAATWRPNYKFRAGKKEKDPIAMEYLAAVTQQSGEDWTGVDMTLSTAAPLLNAAPPDLKMLELALMPRGQQPGGFPNMDPGGRAKNLDEAKGLRSQSQMEYNQKKEAQGGEFLNKAAAIEQSDEILWISRDEVLARRNRAKASAREGQSVTYHLTNRFSVPSRADEQVIEVTRLNFEPEYFYKAVPVLTPHVYRLANLTNKSDNVLLPGEALMYLGTDFVGRQDLPLVAIGEQLTAGFGVDPQVQVQRDLLDKSRTMQGGNQVLKYDYRILISSYKTEPVNLQLWERLPHAETEQVNVSLVKAEPEVCADPVYVREQRPHNLLRWDIKVEPAMNGEKAKAVTYEFKMELDKQMTIGTLQTK